MGKGILYLVGLGICDEEDISGRAMSALAGCRSVFAEQYTNLMREGTLPRLGAKIGKEIVLLPRELVEGEKTILDAAKNGDAALLVPGDPMTATTHSSLIDAARKIGVETQIVHASSIFTAAAGECGLQIYKFGKTATITYWRENFRPTSFLDIIENNQKIGAHTLCLLDIDAEMGPMTVSRALKTILEAQEESGKEIIRSTTKIFALWHAGWEDQRAWAGEVGDWKAEYDRAGPAVVIVLGKMHFAEEESFSWFAKKS